MDNSPPYTDTNPISMGQSPSATAVTSLDYSDSDKNSQLDSDTDADFSDFTVNSNGTRDYTLDLPDDCLAGIFHILSPVDRKNLSLVCHRWLRLDGQTRHRLSMNAKPELPDFIPSLFSRFDSVTKLALRCDRRSPSINDDGLHLISLRCKNLTRLKLRGCRDVTEAGMASLGENCKALKKLSIASCMFGIKGVVAVVERCVVLEELSVKRLRGVYDSNEVIVPAFSSLKSICIKELVNGQSFVPLIVGSKKLLSLKIIGCLGDWDESMEMIGSLNPSLIEIHLEKIQVSDVGIRGVSNCLELDTLHVVKTDCSNLGISMVAERCKLLRKVHIDGWRSNRIGDDGLVSIAKHCPKLQELVLIGLFPTSVSLTEIASNCKNLERLAFCGIGTVGDPEIETIASKCVALKKLCIKGCPISNAGIGALASGCPNLVKVKLKKCRKITGRGLELLRERRVSLAFNYDECEIEALEGSGSDGVGGTLDSTIDFLPAGNEIAEADTPSIGNNSRLAVLRTKFGFMAGRNLVSCVFRRWSNSDDSSSSSIS